MDRWLIIDVILALGVTIRLTRAITVEDIGNRLFRRPVENWADKVDNPVTHENRWFWADALSCPWCVSTWFGILAAAALAIAHAGPDPLLYAYRIVAGGLTLSYLTGRIHTGFGDSDVDDEYDEQESATTG